MVDLPVIQHGGPGCGDSRPRRPPKPDWLKVRAPGGERYAFLKRTLRERGLYTVCEEARCPNVGECWGGGTATFMLLGDVCTRGCRFCAVTTGDPAGRIDRDEPRKLAESIAAMQLRYVVLTMVDRDDLQDGGAAHVAECVREIKRQRQELIVEALVGDFRGDEAAVETVCAAGVDVFAHNVETVSRLQRTVRDARCGYEQSLRVLAHARRAAGAPYTKSSIMLGLGETESELIETFRDLRSVGVDFLTLGQYLQPTPRHLPVREWITPARFAELEQLARRQGFLYVAAGPLVRSSYRAGEYFIESLVRDRGRQAGATA